MRAVSRGGRSDDSSSGGGKTMTHGTGRGGRRWLWRRWLVLAAAAVAAAGVPVASAEDDWANCMPCRCAWVNGRKNADCKRNASVVLSSVPMNLSSEIRSIDFTDQRLDKLRREEFLRAHLGDLQKIKLVNCQLHDVDKFAFRNMSLLIELDMSHNELTTLHPAVFATNPRLRILHLNNNKLERLEDGLFANLTFLQRVELMHNRITIIGLDAFHNNDKLQSIYLDSNRLTNLSRAFAERLESLRVSSLSLQENPWRCDCHLKHFRDFVKRNNVLTHVSQTTCESPERLRGRPWWELESADFACRPRILVPAARNPAAAEIDADGDNVTLFCKVTGDPAPDVNWVFRHAIIDATPGRPGARRYSLTHSDLGDSTYWFNLTIHGVLVQDAGIYKCAAKNPGGIQERNVTLRVSSSYGSGGGGLMSGGASNETWLLILIAVLGLVLLLLLLTVVLWCCVWRKHGRAVARSKGDPMSPNGDISLDNTAADMGKSLITTVNPVVKPPRQYSVPPSVASGVTEVSEVNRTLLDNDSVFAAGDDDSRSFDFIEPTPRKTHSYGGTLGRGGSLGGGYADDGVDTGTIPGGGRAHDRPYPPDLLSFPARGTQVSPAGSSASTVPDHTRLLGGPQSPARSPPYELQQPPPLQPQPPHHLYRTLPYSRSHSPFASPLGGGPLSAGLISPAAAPVAAVAPRSGYVTVPRRPRVPSWSSGPPHMNVPVPEPVYDNLGLRTTAEGSSVLSLNKILSSPATPSTPAAAAETPRRQHALSPPYTPMQPLQASPPPEDDPRRLQRSTQSLLSPSEGGTPGGGSGGWTRAAPDGSSQRSSAENNAALPDGRRLSTSSLASVPEGKKVPPRPPPKPKKSVSTGPLFEDEGEDGTEV